MVSCARATGCQQKLVKTSWCSTLWGLIMIYIYIYLSQYIYICIHTYLFANSFCSLEIRLFFGEFITISLCNFRNHHFVAWNFRANASHQSSVVPVPCQLCRSAAFSSTPKLANSQRQTAHWFSLFSARHACVLVPETGGKAPLGPNALPKKGTHHDKPSDPSPRWKLQEGRDAAKWNFAIKDPHIAIFWW